MDESILRKILYFKRYTRIYINLLETSTHGLFDFIRENPKSIYKLPLIFYPIVDIQRYNNYLGGYLTPNQGLNKITDCRNINTHFLGRSRVIKYIVDRSPQPPPSANICM